MPPRVLDDGTVPDRKLILSINVDYTRYKWNPKNYINLQVYLGLMLVVIILTITLQA
jgi:hypothetical protein